MTKRQKKPTKLRNIIRHEHDPEKDFGWEVCINRRGRIYREYFSDSLHGGKSAALAAAQKARDALLSKLPPPLPVKTRNSLNTSGMVGIAITSKRRKDRDEVYIIAMWPGRGRASFSADRFGFAEAWDRAVKARKQALASLGIHRPLAELPKQPKKKGSVNRESSMSLEP